MKKMKGLNKQTIFIFMIGFFIGVNFAIISHFLSIFQPLCIKDIDNSQHQIRENLFYVPSMKIYEKWLKKQHVFHSNLNLDFELYSPKFDSNDNSKILESEWLKNRVHVTCVVFIERVKMLEAIKNTWGRRCNKLLFIGKRKFKKDVNSPESVICFDTKITSSWQQLCETFNYVWRSNKTETEAKHYLEWVIFVNEDTMIIPENLRFLVALLDFNDDFYLGHSITMWRQKYNVAEAGFVLSRKTLSKLVNKFNSSEKCSKGGRFWKMEDFYLGQHLESLDVHPSDTRDPKLRGIFHGYSLQTLMWGIARPTNYWTKALYPIGSAGCCSPISVTFTVSEADKLYTLDYLLYHLHVYRNLGIYGNRAAPTPIPEEQVWKQILKKEFGLDNITQISNKQYYEIWRSMYSEPEEFIAKNFHAVSRPFPRNQ